MAKAALKVQILGRTWKISVAEPEAFKERFDGEYAGITLPNTMEIVINTDELNPGTVVHEMTHAALAGLCTFSASLSTDQMEEVFCEFTAIHAATLLVLAGKVYKALRKHA